MKIVVDQNGQVVEADAIKFPPGVTVKDLGDGRVLVGGPSATSPEATRTRTVDLPVTAEVEVSKEVTRIGFRTVTSDQVITRHHIGTVTRGYTVTLPRWERSLTLAYEVTAERTVTAYSTGLTVTRLDYGATLTVTRELTKDVTCVPGLVTTVTIYKVVTA